jgi:integrase
LADEWLRGLEQDQKSPATIGAYSTTVELFKTHTGDKFLHEIRPGHIEAFRRSMEDVSPTTRNKHVRYLSACFNSAVKLEKLSRSPVKLAKDPETAQRGSYFTSDEIKKIAAAMDDGVYKRFFLAALRTGMRASELIALRWRNVDTEGGIIRVRDSLSNRQAWKPKTAASRREVFLDPETAKLFATWRDEADPESSDHVFLRLDGKPLTNEDATKRILYPAMERAEVPREDDEGIQRVFHSLRDTYAATWLKAGKPLYDLSLQLGHSSISVTEKRYAHLEQEARRERVADLAASFAV